MSSFKLVNLDGRYMGTVVVDTDDSAPAIDWLLYSFQYVEGVGMTLTPDVVVPVVPSVSSVEDKARDLARAVSALLCDYREERGMWWSDLRRALRALRDELEGPVEDEDYRDTDTDQWTRPNKPSGGGLKCQVDVKQDAGPRATPKDPAKMTWVQKVSYYSKQPWKDPDFLAAYPEEAHPQHPDHAQYKASRPPL